MTTPASWIEASRHIMHREHGQPCDDCPPPLLEPRPKHHYTEHEPTGPRLDVSCRDCTSD